MKKTCFSPACSDNADEVTDMNFTAKRFIHNRIFSAIAASLMLIPVSCSRVDSVNSSNSSPAQEISSQTEPEKANVTVSIAISQRDDYLKEIIEEFNAKDNGYFINVLDFTGITDENGEPVGLTDEEQSSSDFNIIQKIINTDDIDIICEDSLYSDTKYELLREKGAFTDLYQFMDDDPEVNRDTLNARILSLNESGGKLYGIPIFFKARTLIGMTKYVGEKENWTIDEFISHWENMPDNATVTGSMNAENIYYVLLRGNLDSFIDYENAQVHFDSEEFRKTLEFCGRFPSNRGGKSEYDYYAPRFVGDVDLSGIMSAVCFNEKCDIFFHTSGNYTLVGYPSSNGNGAFFTNCGRYFSICANSSPERQRGAWEFIRTFLTYEYQRDNVMQWIEFPGDPDQSYWSAEAGFCMNNKAFEDTAQRVLSGKYYGGAYESKGEVYEMVVPTKENYEQLCRYLDSINRWDSVLDRELWRIIEDEVLLYLSGENSLDHTVDTIQNRASIWISEQA